MPIKLLLRLILAIGFGALAVIFSELIPLEGTQRLILRIAITSAAAIVGLAIFPDIATKITVFTIASFNFFINRIASETLNQLMRLPRGAMHIPLGSPTPQVGGVSLQRPLILDTSSLIDGRILDIGRTGFLFGLALIPNFVLLELQQVADSSDPQKRSRGRRGFEILNDLKKVNGLKIDVWDKESGGKAVDEKLIKLAKNLHGKLITCDFNLNKLAGAHNVSVLNVNDLANAVKTSVVPGEKIETKIVHIGKDLGQGVGYMEDGTMIVVEDGAESLGKKIEIEVSRVLQGPAGKMIFGKKI